MLVNVAGKNLYIHDREEWQIPSRPVTGPSSQPSLVHWAVIHWPGASDTWKPPLDTAAYIRWSHDSYLNGRGYSLGYGWGIGVNPINWNADPIITDIWEIRGFDFRMASNDGDHGIYGDFTNPNFNGRSNSMWVLSSTNYPATDDQILQARYMVALFDIMYHEQINVIPHRTSDATHCPGDYLASKIPEIATRPSPAPEPGPSPVPQKKRKGTTVYAVIAHVSESNAFVYSVDGGLTRQVVRTPSHMSTIIDSGAKFVESGTTVTDSNWMSAPVKTNAQLDALLGPLTT